MWIELTNIVAGLVLAIAFIKLIPALGEELARLSKWLGRSQTIIGVIAIILGLWVLIDGEDLLQSVVAIIAGLVLAMRILPSIPALGKHLEKLAKWLSGFQTIIGVIAILVGIWGLL
jgi:cadmium resistance protein CadD (predicted permease)